MPERLSLGARRLVEKFRGANPEERAELLRESRSRSDAFALGVAFLSVADLGGETPELRALIDRFRWADVAAEDREAVAAGILAAAVRAVTVDALLRVARWLMPDRDDALTLLAAREPVERQILEGVLQGMTAWHQTLGPEQRLALVEDWSGGFMAYAVLAIGAERFVGRDWLRAGDIAACKRMVSRFDWLLERGPEWAERLRWMILDCPTDGCLEIGNAVAGEWVSRYRDQPIAVVMLDAVVDDAIARPAHRLLWAQAFKGSLDLLGARFKRRELPLFQDPPADFRALAPNGDPYFWFTRLEPLAPAGDRLQFLGLALWLLESHGTTLRSAALGPIRHLITQVRSVLRDNPEDPEASVLLERTASVWAAEKQKLLENALCDPHELAGIQREVDDGVEVWLRDKAELNARRLAERDRQVDKQRREAEAAFREEQRKREEAQREAAMQQSLRETETRIASAQAETAQRLALMAQYQADMQSIMLSDLEPAAKSQRVQEIAAQFQKAMQSLPSS